MADRGRRFQPGTLPGMPERRNCGPWYRENLLSKAFTKHNRLKFPGSLNSQRWVFVNEELGDVRKGHPLCRSPITQCPTDAFLPQVHHRAPQPAPKKRQKELPTEAALLSKLSPAQRARKTSIDDMEAHLALHPLSLYPHLEEALPTELLLKVLEVLDPEKKLEDTWAYCQDTRKTTESTKLLEKRPTLVDLEQTKKMPVSHSGRWLYKEKPSRMDLLHNDRPLLHENVHKEVSDFCNWAAAVGGPGIDEKFICKQFDVDYQSRQSCDVLLVMRLNQVPLELKNSAELKVKEAEFVQKLDRGRKPRKPQDSHTPKRVKMRYGAWYLSTNLWTKQRADEPLVDTRVSCTAREENLHRDLQKQEEFLANLHGTAAFKDFIQSRGYRMPRFLEKIYVGKKGISEYRKTPRNLPQTLSSIGESREVR